MNSIHAGAGEPEKADKILRHVVLYKFKDSLKPAEIQEVIDAFAALPSKIGGIVGFEHGTNVSPEGKSEGLTHCFMVSFTSERDRDVYLTHPAHLEYVKVVRDRREKVVVFDYWADR
jgi:hypothetical protein